MRLSSLEVQVSCFSMNEFLLFQLVLYFKIKIKMNFYLLQREG